MAVALLDGFGQAANSLARGDVGLGIGLTLVQRMAADCGGTVSAHSARLGCGSEFVLTLPSGEPPLEVSLVSLVTLVSLKSMGGAPAAEISATRRVLLVGDKIDALEAMAELCELQGLAATSMPLHEIAIVDLGLPGLDGFGLARE